MIAEDAGPDDNHHMDMLVRLYALPSIEAELRELAMDGISIIRALPTDRSLVVRWVRKHTSEKAACEAECCFSTPSPTIFIAVKDRRMIGYACYNATAPDFFGPTEVAEEYRGKGIGKALLVASLNALREEGYGYAIIGSVGPAAFYEKCVGAVPIEDSTPGIYSRMLDEIDND